MGIRKFGAKSQARLNECHPDLQRLMAEVNNRVDTTILCGHRGEAEQNAAFLAGNSKLKWPASKHNSKPSQAVDAAPYPVDWADLKRWANWVAVVKQVAIELKIEVVCGADFKGFPDYPHVELKRKE